jgi:2,3-dihydroxybenzoate decarboxylase
VVSSFATSAARIGTPISMKSPMATVTDEHPTRFGGFAALPLQDPKAAAAELERTVKQYGFCGGLINAHTQGKYLDHHYPVSG